MAKWKCEICGNEFDNFHAQGFDNKIYCPLCYFKKENQELKKENKQLKDQLQQKDNIIKEVREYINHYETIRGYFEYEEDGYDEYNYEEDLKQELLEILDKEVIKSEYY